MQARRPTAATDEQAVLNARFRGALLLVDEVTGHVIIKAIRRGPPRRRGDVRADLAESASWEIRALEEYGLVLNSARKA